MSFSGTPLGQGRRLDHQTFLKGGSQTTTIHSPPRRVAINPPASYAYGAPNYEPQSPSKSPSPRSRRAQTSRTVDDVSRDEDDNILSRYTQLKQRNDELASRPGGPGIITTPPQPSLASAKGTSVNIASAFFQAASSYTTTAATTAMSTSSKWTNKQHVPRSTSVEYEQQAQSTSHRRLAPPPSRTGSRLGTSKPNSRASARGSDIENERSGESFGLNGRAKSPFDIMADVASGVMRPVATILMRQRSQEPEGIQSRQGTDATLVAQNNNSGSYDYADEEEEVERMERASKRNTAASQASRRGRISTDNMAYRPTTSDVEDESEEDEDGRKGRRRRKKKADSLGGPLQNLPKVNYDKRKRRRGRTGRPGEEGEEGSGEEQDQISEEQSLRSGSISRGSIPPPGRNSVPPEPHSYSYGGPTDDSNLEQGLESIPEADEFNADGAEEKEHRYGERPKPRPRSRSRSRVRKTKSFSIGKLLGDVVRIAIQAVRAVIIWILQVIAMLTLICGKTLGKILDITIVRPTSALRRIGIASFGKYVVVIGCLVLSYMALKHPGFNIAPPKRTPSWIAPSYPPGTVDELTTRLLQLENMIADLRAERESEQKQLGTDIRKVHEVAYKVGQLETRVDKEVLRAQEDTRVATFKGLESLQRDIRSLQSQQSEITQSTGRLEGPSKDEEARAKLQALEDRLGSIEGGVKEVADLAQNAAKAAAAAGSAVSGSGASWWNKIGSGSTSGITIKSTDGQDVTSLIGTVVDRTVQQYVAKDYVARVDYALNSGGAGVIPSLTSPSLEVRPTYFFGLVSGSPVFAHSPVYALHHETTLGYCWPFAGSKGSLGVKLARRVYMEDVTIDHVASDVAHDLRPAPRHMEVWGLVEGQDNFAKYQEYLDKKEQARKDAESDGQSLPEEPTRPSMLPKSHPYMRVASFMYDARGSNNVQTFPVLEEVRELGIDFGLIVLAINSNWGDQEFTCLYRFRVHGTPAGEVLALDP